MVIVSLIRLTVTMPRKPIIRSNQHFYHLTGRSNNKKFFEIPLENAWEIMVSELGKLQKQFNIKISAFVLMSNHFHLLMLTPEEDIDRVMFFFMMATTKRINKQMGSINRVYGSRYKGCLIENRHYLMSAYKYVYLNPVRAGIAKRAQDYQFSTLNTSLKLPFDIEEIAPLTLQSRNRELECRWINESFSPEENSSIKGGLSKTKFTYKKNRSKKKDIKPENNF